jgi:FKBP-type peptidyl-prolyl cis-trans isomerase 2
MSTVEKGQTVSVHYVGTFDDGTEFDNSRLRGEPLSFEVGSGQVIAGFDAAVQGLLAGETKQFTVDPGDAYGDVDPKGFVTVDRKECPDIEPARVGEYMHGTTENGDRISCRIHACDENEVTLDYNHPLAGKILKFDVELISIQ